MQQKQEYRGHVFYKVAMIPKPTGKNSIKGPQESQERKDRPVQAVIHILRTKQSNVANRVLMTSSQIKKFKLTICTAYRPRASNVRRLSQQWPADAQCTPNNQQKKKRSDSKCQYIKTTRIAKFARSVCLESSHTAGLKKNFAIGGRLYSKFHPEI